jgi:hypothetical protein
MLIAIGIALSITLAPVRAQEATEPQPQGFFVLNDDKGPFPLPDWVFRDELIAGISLRGSWTQVEAREGRLTWFFDKDVARAKKAGKAVILRVHLGMMGRGVPAWVYDAGAQRFEFSRDSKPQTMPIPWDPTHLNKWKTMVRALGKQYAGDNSIVMIQMGGLDITGGEMHLPSARDDRERWRRAGYTKQKLVAAWAEVIDTYAEAFPRQYLGLNVSVPVERDGVVEDVLAHAKKRLGRRLCVQHNALAAKTDEDGYPHRWILASKGEAVIGFQELCPVTPQGKFNDEGRRFGGTLEQALGIGLRSGMRYVEAYPPDLQNTALRPVLRDYATKLKGSR